MTKIEVITFLKNKKDEFYAKYGITTLGLYGSYARDEATNSSDVDIFYSTQSVPGASQAFIYRFHSVEDSTASWQAVMYSGETYKDAAKVYKNTFRQITKSRLNFGNGKTGHFEGTYTEPTEDLRFTSSILYTREESGPYKHFIANIDMVNNFGTWEVRLSLNRKRDDREKY